MREIKFRAWSIKGKTMWHINKQMTLSIEGDSWQIRDNAISNRFMCSWHEDEKGILMQFTGLKDKNGKEIYEGDIICPDKNNQNEKTVGSVEWHEQLACFIVRYKDGTGWKSFIEMEVIGNIYENPELLRKDL